MNESSAKTASSTRMSGGGRSLPVIAFAAFVSQALPLVLRVFAGEHVDAVLWTVPLFIPSVLVLVRLQLPAPDTEAERQAADISRWDV